MPDDNNLKLAARFINGYVDVIKQDDNVPPTWEQLHEAMVAAYVRGAAAAMDEMLNELTKK